MARKSPRHKLGRYEKFVRWATRKRHTTMVLALLFGAAAICVAVTNGAAALLLEVLGLAPAASQLLQWGFAVLVVLIVAALFAAGAVAFFEFKFGSNLIRLKAEDQLVDVVADMLFRIEAERSARNTNPDQLPDQIPAPNDVGMDGRD